MAMALCATPACISASVPARLHLADIPASDRHDHACHGASAVGCAHQAHASAVRGGNWAFLRDAADSFGADSPLSVRRQVHGERRSGGLRGMWGREVRSIAIVRDRMRGLRGRQAPGVHGQRRGERLRGVRCR